MWRTLLKCKPYLLTNLKLGGLNGMVISKLSLLSRQGRIKGKRPAIPQNNKEANTQRPDRGGYARHMNTAVTRKITIMRLVESRNTCHEKEIQWDMETKRIP